MTESKQLKLLVEHCAHGASLSDAEALSLAGFDDMATLVQASGKLRNDGFDNVVTYSRKVFIPLTTLCRDVCHYCTFAKTPGKIRKPFMTVDEVLASCRSAVELGCKEALFTLGEKPELRYRVAREALDKLGFETTLDYVAHVAERVIAETGLLVHINAGCMTRDEIKKLRPVSASMGIMLESASERLCEKGMPHYGSPDKLPSVRLKTIDNAGISNVPFTSGILIGIGETRVERIEALLQLRASHRRHGHLQEIIIQNFRAKVGTKMAQVAEPAIEDLTWTIAIARLIFGAGMNIQAPPNLNSGSLVELIDAGINDWGGVSPLTPDFVNPEAPWPHIAQLAARTRTAGKHLQERLTIYPEYAVRPAQWLAKNVREPVLRLIDASGYARADNWVAGELVEPPAELLDAINQQVTAASISVEVSNIVAKARRDIPLDALEITRLFEARGNDFSYVCREADALRRETNGDVVSYVVNRNINYTNLCYYNCQFCAFSKPKQDESAGDIAYDLDDHEIARRCREAWARGATEVCMQGGIHPRYTGQHYLDILATVKAAVPEMHVHAFSPLEVWQGAKTLGIAPLEYLTKLQHAGLGSLPGTAAEILDDEVRSLICPDKLSANEWLDVIEMAHTVGLRTSATMMFGHVDAPIHWAQHLIKIRELQRRTDGFTEFVPLPFVASEAPIYARGEARKGPTFRESVLVHAVSRIVFHGLIDNIQASWVKLGTDGVAACLQAGANDVGGSLMNESITRAAGAKHGQEWSVAKIASTIKSLNRVPRQRTTLYGTASQERQTAAERAQPLSEVIFTAPRKGRQNAGNPLSAD